MFVCYLLLRTGESILNHLKVDVVEIQQKNLLREVSAEEMKLAQVEDEVIVS